MDVSRALTQIAEIHQQMAKAEVYRGYRSVPVAASGVIGIVAAAVQPRYAGWSVSGANLGSPGQLRWANTGPRAQIHNR